ncbi:MAG: tyrosine-type recombinase/integrase [Polyangiales bacterium]
MGCVYERGPSNWWIKWREGARVRYSGGFATRDQAERVLNKVVADLAAGRAGLPPDLSGVPTLAALATDWLERRKLTHRAATDDAGRWNNHLRKHFGDYRPNDVDAASVRKFIETKLASGLNPATVGHCVRLLSTFFADLVERGLATANPIRALPRSTRRLYRPTVDAQSIPFLHRLDDVQRVYAALPSPLNVAFAVGALAGLRTGEVLAVKWSDIDLVAGRIRVHEQVKDGKLGPLKDDDSRIVPIVDSLRPVLAKFKLATGGDGLLFQPTHPTRGGRPTRPATFVRPQTLHKHLVTALVAAKVESMTWYQATRHTFASLWVSSGGSIEKLSMMMGHSSVVVTQRYAHLRPELFRPEDLALLNVDLARTAKVTTLRARTPRSRAVGYAAVTRPRTARAGSAQKP